MEMRRTFTAGDLNYLANLCHRCGACYTDCQYSPPHDFNVNIPKALAALRRESYEHVWPGFLQCVFASNGLVIALLTAFGLAGFLLGFVALVSSDPLYAAINGNFYRLMVVVFGLVALFCILSFAISTRAFWRDARGSDSAPGFSGFWRAVVDSLYLTHLHGGGSGCTSESEEPSSARRIYHHLTFYGFLFCFVATCIGLIVGPVGLVVLTAKRESILTDPGQRTMSLAFLWTLMLVSVSGLLLLALRDTGAMGILLAIHLGFVLGLFLALPYGKFVHGLYRFLALVKYAGERKKGAFVE